MKIVDLNTFLKLPNGTVYAKFTPCEFEDICVKEFADNELDWIYSPLLEVDADELSDVYNITNESYVEGTSFNLDVNYTRRDGFFDTKQLFAVYEKHDLVQLIDKLNDSLKKAY